MTRARAALIVCLLALALAPSAADAQDQSAPKLPAWAPQWRKGDWWVIRTYQRDLSERATSPAPAEGAAPRTPDDPRREPLPGLPPLNDGAPQGWKKANTFRFEVVRRELVRYPDDAPDDLPEPFLVVLARTQEGEPRAAELWYTEADLTLARVVLAPGSDRPRTRELSGRALLEPAETAELGFPLDWPDFLATSVQQPQADVPFPGRGVVEQRLRVVGQGAAEETQLRLALKGQGEEEGRARVLITFKKDQPFWVRLAGPMYLAELIEQGRAPR